MGAAVHTEHVARSFKIPGRGDFYALKDINIDIPVGKLAVLKGRSGSGKTTLLNILSTLDVPSGGEVWFDGAKLSQLSERQKEKLRRQKMGFVFQSVALIPVMSAYENMEFALRLSGYDGDRDSRIRELMARVGLSKRMHHMANQLSGGEQQRVAIARAVGHHPSVIFADEPTGALDTEAGIAVVRLFKELVAEENTTVLMTTHDPNLMELGDIVYEIADGSIL